MPKPTVRHTEVHPTDLDRDILRHMEQTLAYQREESHKLAIKRIPYAASIRVAITAALVEIRKARSAIGGD